MPKAVCRVQGRAGLTYGKKGKCYTGKDKEKKVNRQIAAMRANGYKG